MFDKLKKEKNENLENLTKADYKEEGIKAFYNKDYELAYKYLEKYKTVDFLPNLLDNPYLGILYYYGLGVQKDYDKAEKCFTTILQGNFQRR